MSAVRSLGVHEPAALSFLLAEKILPPYAWKTSADDVDDEIVYTKTCVVWSRGGIVKRVFRLDFEKEDIRHALFTSFQCPTSQNVASQDTYETARALVVVLKSQAHLFFLSGISQTIPLPFEVESVFGTPRGLLFQRKVYEDGRCDDCSGNVEDNNAVKTYPMAPPNSFASTVPVHSQFWEASAGRARRPSSSRRLEASSLPRVFSLMDPHAEMGLVVTGQSNLWSSRGGKSTALDPADEIVYASSKDELSVFAADASGLSPPLILVVTVSSRTGLYTIWTAHYREGENVSIASRKKRRRDTGGGVWSKRRSSHLGMSTGATTPVVARLSSTRESFGLRSENRNTSSFSYSQSQTEGKPDEDDADDLATKIGQDFGDVGVPLKTSRRVSSLLARADLASGQDRITFSDLATGTQSGISSHGHGGARHSMGGASFRGSFGFNPRGSLPPGTTGSLYSATSNFSDAPVDNLLEELNSKDAFFEGFQNIDLNGTTSSLPEEVLLAKVESFPPKFVGNFHSSGKINRSRRLRVSVLCVPESQSSSSEGAAALCVCIVDQDATTMTLAKLKAERIVVSNKKKKKKKEKEKKDGQGSDAFQTEQKQTEFALKLRMTDLQHTSDVLDAVKIVDGSISRILTLSATESGRRQCQLSLHSPWSNVVNIEVPAKLMRYEPFAGHLVLPTSSPREGGANRVIEAHSLTFMGLDHASSRGKFDAIDSQNQRHRLQIQMESRNELVRTALRVCKLALRDAGIKAGEGLLDAWWAIMKWLHSREEKENDLEWTAFVMVLFAMAVPFIDPDVGHGYDRASNADDYDHNNHHTGESPLREPPQPRKRKSHILRSSSGSYIDSESWEKMLDQESGGSRGVAAPWMTTSAWGWIVEQDAEDVGAGAGAGALAPASPSQSHRRTMTDPLFLGNWSSTFRKNSYILRCTALTRELLRSTRDPTAAAAMGGRLEDFLPTANAHSSETRRTALCTVLIGLHLLREEQKLSLCDSEQSFKYQGLLAPVLAQLGRWLGWPSWTWKDEAYYGVDLSGIDRWLFEDSQISTISVPEEPFKPPSVFSFIEQAWHQPASALFTLFDLAGGSKHSAQIRDSSTSNSLWQECFRLTPRTLALNGFFSEIHNYSTPADRIKLLLRWGLSRLTIESFPESVSVPLHEAIMQCQIDASTSWHPALLEMIDRDDLSVSVNEGNRNNGHGNQHPVATAPSQLALSHDAQRDVHYIMQSALEPDVISSFEASAEADRFAISRLIFREDKRFAEATKLLNQSKAPVAECIPEPDWSDSDLLDAQKELVQIVSFRTLSIPAGRAMLTFSGRIPLLTEKLPIPSFTLQCVMKPSNVTVSADRAAFSEEKVCWAFFHNGVSSGLAISRACKGIDTSWILFNKPAELTNRHAGFLLALGLNGHLKSLAKWVAFKYLTPKHTMTSIGLLLGLSASYLGTMDTLITRLLSVHVTRMLPLGAAELNLSPMTQTAGIMGIGLLYCNSQHRRMSEVMLSEIENLDDQDDGSSASAYRDGLALRDEGYRLAAGFALGLICLGKGKDLRGMRDMHIVERLLAVAVGTKKVDLAHVLDRATSGATIALALIFMKTNDRILASKIDVPDTTVRFDYVRPDIFLLRTLARHLIMWDSIQATEEWVKLGLPRVYRHRYRLVGVFRLKSKDLPFFNIVAGLCFSIGLRFAGSAHGPARDVLLLYLDQFMRICRLPATSYDSQLARNSVRNCQDVVALSAAAVMAGTGDLPLLRRLRSLHGRVDPETPYGSHMAAHMALGMLFLGGGSFTLGTSDLATAMLLCSLYPVFPSSVLDNKCHLQAFRHLWVLAAEARCLVPRDLDSRRPISVPILVTMANGVVRKATAPCLLPDLGALSQVEIRSADHWPMVLNFGNNDSSNGNSSHVLREKFQTGNQSVYLRRRPATSMPSGSSVFASTLSTLSEAQDILPTSTVLSTGKGGVGVGVVPSAILSAPKDILDSLASSSSFSSSSPSSPLATILRNPVPQSQNMWDWVFQLPALRGLDVRERAMVLSSVSALSTRAQMRRSEAQDANAHSDTVWLRASSVDSRLVLENTVLGVIAADLNLVRDRIWQLRAMFRWFGRNADDNGQGLSNGLWLRREFIDEARWKVWGIQVGDTVG